MGKRDSIALDDSFLRAHGQQGAASLHLLRRKPPAALSSLLIQ